MIVGLDEERESSQSSCVVRVGAFIGPLLQQGLDESLGLAVGLRSVVARASVRGSDGVEGLVERPRFDVALGVVGHDPLDGDPVLRQMGRREKDEPRCGLASLIVHGKRELSKTHIRRLARHFKLDPGYFL